MKWNYICPYCNEWRYVDWEKREGRFKCEKMNKTYVPPTPSDQEQAYVDTHEWPELMEEVVVGAKGLACTVPGCEAHYETLDHRIPFSRDGRTCVENLFPMCNEHNQSKGDKNYEVWLLARELDKG
jgi:5-methylcytosine-specific restriction endonuclease McrA